MKKEEVSQDDVSIRNYIRDILNIWKISAKLLLAGHFRSNINIGGYSILEKKSSASSYHVSIGKKSQLHIRAI